MDIAFNDYLRLSNIGTPGTSVSGSHSVPANDKNAVVYALVTWNAGSISATYGGVAMTVLQGTTGNLAVFVLRNPPTGSQTVTVTTTLSSTTVADIVSYLNIATYSLTDGIVPVSGITGSSPAITNITPKSDGCWIVAWHRCNATATLGGSGFTSRNTGNNIIMADTNGPVARNTQMTFNTTYTPAGATTNHILIAMRPARAAAGLI